MCRSMWSYVVSEPQAAECNWVHGVAPRCDWTPSARLHIWVLLSLFHRGESGAARAGFEGTRTTVCSGYPSSQQQGEF
jgi:hypothetical protein